MQRWQGARITHPLAENEAPGSDRAASEPMAARPSAVTDAPTVRVRAVPVSPPAPATSAQPAPGAGRATMGDTAEIGRIREILVGPHMRDHERRLRALEQRQAAPAAAELPAGLAAQVEEALARIRQARDEQDQAHAFAVAQLKAQLTRERDEREDFVRALDAMRAEQQALRAEFDRERQAREELAATHARAIAELAKQLEHESQAHVRLHAHLSTALDARLERERQSHADDVRRMGAVQAEGLRAVREAQTAQGEDARRVAQTHTEALRTLQSAHADVLRRLDETHGVRVETLRELVGEAERALTTMQAERQYLAGLLAELGLHLVRHAASPAASNAAQAAEAFFDASGKTREP